MLRSGWIAVVLALLTSHTASAQPLADRVPSDALIYVAWTGSKNLGPGYEQSHLKQLLDQSGFRQIAGELMPELFSELLKHGGGAGTELDEPETKAAVALFDAIWKYPVAFYLGGLVFSDEAPPQMNSAFVISAGEDGERLHRILDALGQRGAPAPIQVNRNDRGDILIAPADLPGPIMATLGFSPDAAAQPVGVLSAHGPFRASMRHVLPSPVLVGYVDVEGILTQFNRMAAFGAERDVVMPDPVMMLPALAGPLGMDGIKRATFTTGFDGRKWGTRIFVEAPAPRRGLAALLDHAPLSERAWRSIPAGATVAGAIQVDPSRILNEFRRVAGELEPEKLQEFNEGLTEVNAMVGFNIEQDLLAALGTEWLYFADPTIGGEFPFGLVLVNPLRDATRFQHAMARTINLANLQLLQLTREQGNEDVSIQIRSRRIGERTIHHIGMPLLSFAWTVADDQLLVALTPEILLGVLERPADAPSLWQSEKLTALRRQLAVEAPAGFSYVDVPRLFPRSYPLLSIVGRLPLGMAELVDIENVPAIALPPLSRIMPTLGPSVSTFHVDEHGFHFRSVESWPMAGKIATMQLSGLSTATLPVFIGTTLPALGQARQTANRIKSQANARGIAQFTAIHVAQNRTTPDSLGDLLIRGMDPLILISPYEPTPPTPPRQGASNAELRAWAERNSSYVYIRSDRWIESPFIPVAYDRAMLRARGGTAVAFTDGSTAYMEAHMLPAVIREMEGMDEEVPAMPWDGEQVPRAPH
ncbi:MAG: hypothetical protein JJU36_08210 [Phycisphaeraceae bacterium]|nr:hypothetical protein [Phycisphaeraceae bacterium]